MADPKFIEKEQLLAPGLDYDFLKKRGIEYIQALAGDNWTDFNAHDPGITILEQLAYALTDIGYRSNMDFKDLLASQEEPLQKDTFFTAADILPTNPITVNDFRKIIIDRVKGIQNIWIQPLNSFTRRKNIKGLYLAFIEIDTHINRKEEEIRLEARSLLNRYSNLGEAFEDVVILKKQEIYLQCQIDLDKNAIAEKVHAEIIFELEKVITKPLMFYSLNEMIKKGFSICEIFDGPRLLNGFIKDKFLTEKDNVFYNSQLLNRIREIEGVKTIKSFNLVVEDIDDDGNIIYRDYVDELSKKVINEIVIIKWDSVAVLGSKIYKEANNHDFISYTNDGVHIHLFQKDVDRYFKGLEAKVKLKYNHNFKQENNLPVPIGKTQSISQYYSIQHQFPNIYGLTENAISDKTSHIRQAEIYQLKAYLLFFEQIMSNYLAQLSNFTSLYSVDKDLTKSYFTQIPSDIPNLYKLVGQLDSDESEDNYLQSFQIAVEKVMAGIDNFNERRSKFISHLLARFGDDSYKYSFEKFSYYFTKSEHQINLRNNTLDILEHYNWLSGNKARSFDNTSKFWSKKNKKNYPERDILEANLSTLESRIRMKIGLPHKVTKIATNLVPKVNFDENQPEHSLNEILDASNAYKMHTVSTETKGIWVKEDEFKDSDDLKLISKITINEDLFKRGIWDENLSVLESPIKKDGFLLLFKKKLDLAIQDHSGELLSKITHLKNSLEVILSTLSNNERVKVLISTESNGQYCLVFEKNDSNLYPLKPVAVWQVIAKYKKEDSAFKGAFSLKNHLIILNTESEGFYVMDHILLRPRDENVKINILLNDPNADWSFRLSTSYPIDGVEDGIKHDILEMRKLPYQFTSKKDWILIIWKKGDKIIGRCNQKYKSKVEAEQKAKEIQAYFNQFSDLDIHDSSRVKFKREIEDCPHPLHHYSFTLTVFLSNWTGRFSDKEFQYLLESLFRKNTPAHIAIQFKWIDLKDMAMFEELYSIWLEENRKEEINYNFLNSTSSQLLALAKVL